MKTARALALLGLLSGGGCWPSHPPAPEEVALDRYDESEKMFAAGAYADAAPGYEFAIKARHLWKDPYVKLARCHEALGREDLAVQVLQRLLEVDRTDEEGLRALARLQALRKP